MYVQVAHHTILTYFDSWQSQTVFNLIINGENSIKI